LGAYYWAGRGVPQDLTKAYFWSILAQAGGDQASKYRVAVLTSRMSRSQVVAAQEDANQWLQQHQVTLGKPSPARQLAVWISLHRFRLQITVFPRLPSTPLLD